jgi:ferrous iron transport protein B
MMSRAIIGLVGNPNCGKTTLFNALTGANQRVGNWAGVTVDRKEGKYRHDDQDVIVVDLPGVYSLDAEDSNTGLDELIARDYLLSQEATLIVNIVDASNIERNLYLTTQILEMGVPMIVALNMMDMAKERDIKIDPVALSEQLGCPVIPMSAASKQGLPKLKACIRSRTDEPAFPTVKVTYPPALESAIAILVPTIEQSKTQVSASRWTALNLLISPIENLPQLRSLPELAQSVIQQQQQLENSLEDDIDIIVADSRYGFIRTLMQQSVQRTREVRSTVSDRIDRIVMNRWLGIPIFLMVMYLMFAVSVNLGAAFIDFFDKTMETIFVSGVANVLKSWNSPGWLIGLLATGVGGGMQTTATFIPQIGMLFIFLCALEDSGYMSRAAFVMDRVMRFVGLPGKSFVPMLIGFGCNIPGIMATRTLENRRDRLMTVMMNPFMSCSARLTVYALFCAAFFQSGAQNIVLGLYFMGILAAVFTGLVLKNTILKGEAAPFIMELPPYHIPKLSTVLIRAWERLGAFIKKAGKAIVVMVVILGFLNSVGTDGSFGKQDSQASLLSAFSRTVTPVFAPIGITQENWPATVGLMSGVFAKEVMVGTLNALYTELGTEAADAKGAEEEPYSFWGGIGGAFATIPTNLAKLPGQLFDPLGLHQVDVGGLTREDIAKNNDKAKEIADSQSVSITTYGQMAQRFGSDQAAFAYLLFVLLYFPCVSATAAMYRETNLGWTVFAVCWTTGLAYIMSVSYYQIATAAQHPLSSLLWVGGMGLVLASVLVGLKLSGSKRRATLSS